MVAASYGAGVLTGVVGVHSASTAAEAGVLDEAAARIMADAATPVSRDQLDRAAVEGMLKALGDRWSAYYQPAEFASFQAGLDGRYSGIGVWLRRADDGQIYVGSVQPGTPAAAGRPPRRRPPRVRGRRPGRRHAHRGRLIPARRGRARPCAS